MQKGSAMIFTRKAQGAAAATGGRSGRPRWGVLHVEAWRPGGVDRGVEKETERAQKSRPSNLEQSIRFPQMSHLPGRPRLDAVLAVPALPCTSGNRNDGPLPWQTNKLPNTLPHSGSRQTAVARSVPNIAGHIHFPGCPARTAFYINGCIILSVWDLSRLGQWHQWHPVLGRCSPWRTMQNRRGPW